jgi:ribosome biogenesis protein Nip4
MHKDKKDNKKKERTHLLGVIVNNATQLWMRYVAAKHDSQRLVTARQRCVVVVET